MSPHRQFSARGLHPCGLRNVGNQTTFGNPQDWGAIVNRGRLSILEALRRRPYTALP